VSVQVEAVTRRFDRRGPAAVDAVSFEAEQGGITTLLGPSGSGKSTLLRIIAGLEPADAGRILLAGRDVSGVAVQQRGVGFVFQSYALFEHLDVRANVAFGLELRKIPRAEIDERVSILLKRVQLSGLDRRHPGELSGGQRQRVAFARALAIEPQVLLLDEPFGALDTRVRIELRAWLRRLHEEMPLTTILVTHDQDEALEVSSKIVVMNAGRVEQVGDPHVVYDEPKTAFVASFVGGASLLRGEVRGGRAELGRLAVTAPAGAREGDRVQAFVRAHDIELKRADDDGFAALDDGEVTLARIERVSRNGGTMHVGVRLNNGDVLTVHLSRAQLDALGVGEGDRVRIDLRAAQVFVEDYAI
jgi:sulfate/thiosulfate transport system ATP-binding protein